MLLVIRILLSGSTTFFSCYLVCELNFEHSSRLPVCVGLKGTTDRVSWRYKSSFLSLIMIYKR